MGKRVDVFRRVVELGAARLFLDPPSLTGRLDKDPAGTLFGLSSAPEDFGIVKLEGEERRLALQHVLTAATAYVRAARMGEDPPSQPELELEEM